MEQLATNTTTWYVILPIMLIMLAGIIWFIIGLKTVIWKKVVMILLGFFSFIGFSAVLLSVYYQTSTVFSGSFDLYAYSVFAPERDPFDIPEGDYDTVLATFGVYKENGELKVMRVPNSSTQYGAYLFSPGKWMVVDVNDDVITLSESEPNITEMSFWWAMTKDLYNLKVSVE